MRSAWLCVAQERGKGRIDHESSRRRISTSSWKTRSGLDLPSCGKRKKWKCRGSGLSLRRLKPSGSVLMSRSKEGFCGVFWCCMLVRGGAISFPTLSIEERRNRKNKYSLSIQTRKVQAIYHPQDEGKETGKICFSSKHTKRSPGSLLLLIT